MPKPHMWYDEAGVWRCHECDILVSSMDDLLAQTLDEFWAIQRLRRKKTMPHAWTLVNRGGEWGVARWRCLYCYMDAWGDEPDRIEDNCTRSH